MNILNMSEDQILSLILTQQENELNFIETLLEEQTHKSVKFPLTVFFSKKSILEFPKLLNKIGLFDKQNVFD